MIKSQHTNVRPAAFFLFFLPAAAQSPSPTSFPRVIEPLFRERCYACHGPRQQMSGLRLDLRDPALAGGYSGKVILPGDSANSRLIQMASGTTGKFMPPAGARLTPEQIASLKSWIDQGAVWPETAKPTSAAPSRSNHWSFLPPRRLDPPSVRNAQWIRNPIDAFILARLEQEDVSPSREADRITLIRRVTLDLTGLPPTPAETAAFLADPRPDAYERLVDRLLIDPHYGEKWARHWLDLARYADSDGYEKDLPRPFAWRYRQWVIDALNQDMPFDRFTLEQIAGDLLPGATAEQRVATGFHRNALTNREGGIDREQLRVEQAVDRTSTVSSVWLGLTAGCAQCHDHKYDPISQKEFYQLYAFFNPAEEIDIEAPMPGEMGPYLRALPEYRAQRKALLEQYGVAALQKEWEPKVIEAGKHQGIYGGDWDLAWTVLWNDERKILLKDPATRTQKEQDKLTDHFLEWYSAVVSKERYQELKFKELREKLQRLAASFPALSEAQTIADLPNPPKAHVLLRGDFRSPGIEVAPGTLAFLPSPSQPPTTRLDLARWIASSGNPLTARVAVNRMWQAFFGKGIVATASDFGTQGERPTHPELLDWLATEFVSRGWSVKQMHRLIVTSATYRQSSSARPELSTRDPYNRWLARQNRLRLEAELIRDSALAVSGLLNPAIGGPSVRPPQPAGLTNLGYGDFVKWKESEGKDRYRRGLYIFFQRTVPYPELMTFDVPDSNVTCPRRERSMTPLQALNTLNDPVFMEAADALAVRILRDQPGPSSDRLLYAFRLCLARDPNPLERARLASFLDSQTTRLSSDTSLAAKFSPVPVEGVTPAEMGAWVALSRSLLNLDEFLTRE